MSVLTLALCARLSWLSQLLSAHQISAHHQHHEHFLTNELGVVDLHLGFCIFS